MNSAFLLCFVCKQAGFPHSEKSVASAFAIKTKTEMGKYGRPKLSTDARRDCLSLNVRLNREERETVERKAREAGVTVTEWARLAAVEKSPPARRVIPEINRVAWLELAPLAAMLNGANERFQNEDDPEITRTFDALRQELASVRNGLIGNGKEGER